MLDRLRTLLHTLRSLDEIDGLSDRDLADISLSRAEVADLARMSAAIPARMARMAAVFGVSEADLTADRATAVEATQRCAHCGAARTCAHQFAEGTVTVEAAAGYCPNAALYRDLAARAH